jgi:hypothetical protein
VAKGDTHSFFRAENNTGGDSGAIIRHVPSAGEKEPLDGSPCGPLDISSSPHYNTARG